MSKSKNYRVNLKRVPTTEEIRSLIAEVRKIDQVDQIIMGAAINNYPRFDFTLHPGASESEVRPKVNKRVKSVSRDLL